MKVKKAPSEWRGSCYCVFACKAVSYEARAAGLRAGDGAGAGARANIVHLRERLSEAQARLRCPGLRARRSGRSQASWTSCNYAKKIIVGRIITSYIPGYRDKHTMECAGAMP